MEKDRDAPARVEVERTLLERPAVQEPRRTNVGIEHRTVVLDASVAVESIQRHGETAVLVNDGVLQSAMHRTGMQDATALVEFALGLLTEHDPSADIARAARGSLPGFDLPI